MSIPLELTTAFNLSYCRMREKTGSPGTFGFRSDNDATVTASSAASGLAASSVQYFSDLGMGPPWRSTGSTSEYLLWDFGSATATNWIFVSARGSAGLRYPGATPATLSIGLGNTTAADAELADLTYSKALGGWYHGWDAKSYRYAKLTIAGSGGSPGYFQIARVALDSWTTLGTNWQIGVSLDQESRTVALENDSGAMVQRWRSPITTVNLRFQGIGMDSDDLADWHDWKSFAGEDRGAYQPEMPFFAAINPDMTIDGTAGHIFPGFWVLAKPPRFAEMGQVNGKFESALQLREVG